MSTPPIRIPITADDHTQRVFQDAAGNVQRFQGAVDRSAYSMREARGAAMLLGEEVGVRLNRHLATTLAHSQLIGPMLAGAFSAVAVVGFLDYLERIPEALKKATDFFGGFTKAAKDAMDEAVASNEKIYKSFKDIATGYELLQSLQRVQIENQATAPKSDMEGTGSTAWQGFKVAGPVGALGGYFYQIYETRKKINEASDRDLKLLSDQRSVMEQLTKLFDDRNKKEEEAEKKGADAAARRRKEIEKEIDKYNEAINKQLQLALGVMRLGIEGPTPKPSFSLISSEYPGLRAYGAEAGVVPDEVQANMEVAQKYLENFNKRVEESRHRLEEARQAAQDFGSAIGRAMEEGMLMGRSWGDVLRSLLVTIAELIVRLTLLKKLQASSFGSGGGFGGFITGIVGGFAGGHASGGVIPPGMWGVVGEKGPELAFGGSSGMSISPGVGGTTINNYIDARGDLAQEQRIYHAIKMAHDDAIRTSVGMNRERALRGAN